MTDPTKSPGGGAQGGSGGAEGRPADPGPGSPEDTHPPGSREVPAPGTPEDREALRRLKERAREPSPPKPGGQPDRG